MQKELFNELTYWHVSNSRAWKLTTYVFLHHFSTNKKKTGLLLNLGINVDFYIRSLCSICSFLKYHCNVWECRWVIGTICLSFDNLWWPAINCVLSQGFQPFGSTSLILSTREGWRILQPDIVCEDWPNFVLNHIKNDYASNLPLCVYGGRV